LATATNFRTTVEHLALTSSSLSERLEVFERLLAIQESRRGPEFSGLHTSLNRLAVIQQALGAYSEARSLWERSISLLERTRGFSYHKVGIQRVHFSGLLQAMGAYAEAREQLERALRIFEEVYEPRDIWIGRALAALGSIHREMGSYGEARTFIERGIEIMEAGLPSDHPYLTEALVALALIHQETASYAEAKSLLQRALRIQESRFGTESVAAASILDRLAALLVRMGDFGEARRLMERAREIREQRLGAEHPAVADSLENLASLPATVAPRQQARVWLERAVAIREKALGPEHPLVARALSTLAELLVESGDRARGLEAALRAEDLGREHARLTIRSFAEERALRYAAVRASGLDLALTLLAGGGAEPTGAPRLVWDAAIRSRALVLDEVAARHRTARQTPDVAPLAGDLTRARERLANLMVRGPGEMSPETYRRLLDDARKERLEAEDALARGSAAFADERARSLWGVTDVARALPPDCALLSFVRYGKLGSATAYLAFVLPERAADPIVVPLGPAERIENLVSAWREGDLAEAPHRRTGALLRHAVWDPVASHLEGARRVLVVPDGALNLVNLAALPVGEHEYVVEKDPTLHYLSTERDLSLVGGRGAEGVGLLAVGGAAYDAAGLFAALRPAAGAPEIPLTVLIASATTYRGPRSDCGDFRSMRFGSLPAAESEAREVAALWKQAGRSPSDENSPVGAPQGASGALLLTGPDAGEAAVKAQAPGRRVLHLATHGFFLGVYRTRILGHKSDVLIRWLKAPSGAWRGSAATAA